MNKRFKLVKTGKVSREKGDACQDTGNGFWILATHEGERGIIPGETWRRPKTLRPTDLHEHTFTFED